MTVVTGNRKSVRGRKSIRLRSLTFSRFFRYNPGLSKPALVATGKVMAVVSAAAARLSVEQQRRIAANETELVHIGSCRLGLATKSSHTLAKVPVEKFVEVSQGMGPGQLVDKDEGRRRLAE